MDSTRDKKILYSLFGFIAFVLFYHFIFSPPSNFPTGTVVNIGEGAGLRSVSRELKDAGVIRSRAAFEAAVIIFGGERRIIPADYLFDVREPSWSIARRVSRGDRHLAPVKATIPEGFDRGNIADLFSSRLTAFNKSEFLRLTEGREGYLFPDTYFFFTNDTEEEVINSMEKNYEKKVAPLREDIAKTGRTEHEIVIMASVIEREAEGTEDRGHISGILWRRLKIGMALQADAAPETYKERGLPKAPIANPGLDSIRAAINPIETPYLYYLHDQEGNIYFAKTFAEHRANIEKYLKNQE